MNAPRIYCIDNVDSYEMYKLRIYVSCMSKNVILLPRSIYGDTLTMGGCTKTLYARKSLEMQRTFIWQCAYLVFKAYLMFEIYRVFTELTMLIHTKCVNHVYNYIWIMSENVILLPTYVYLCRYVYYGRVSRTF